MMGIIMAGMVITGSEKQGRPKSVQPGNQEWITVIQAINAEQGGESIYIYLLTPKVDRCRCLVIKRNVDR
jgi:hypothetical protein